MHGFRNPLPIRQSPGNLPGSDVRRTGKSVRPSPGGGSAPGQARGGVGNCRNLLEAVVQAVAHLPFHTWPEHNRT
eukprot:2523260-Alexandrium_andersonii.AAC.1